MCPNSKRLDSVYPEEETMELVAPQASPRTYKVVYLNVLVYGYWHIAGLVGLYQFFGAKWQTVMFTLFTYLLSVLGVTAGAHRLWSHRTYEANRPLQVFLMLCHTMACQNSVVYWVRDHRLHHKYTDTDADPHNSTRGLFYSHCGWILVRKHPEVAKRGKTIDISDVNSNQVLKFQKKYILPLTVLLGIALPTLIPMLWGETFSHAWYLSHLRLIVNLNATFLINSANHAFGHKPYDNRITATNIAALTFLAVGESYHNYHHVFPWDYRTSELGNTFGNTTTIFIDFCGRRGWAWGMKSASGDVVEKRKVRTGDGKKIGRDGEWDDRGSQTQDLGGWVKREEKVLETQDLGGWRERDDRGCLDAQDKGGWWEKDGLVSLGSRKSIVFMDPNEKGMV